MYSAGLHHQGIFRVSGSQVEINNFKDAFERGEDPLADMTDASDINSVAGVLKLYLRELREPLFPIIYFEQFMELARKQFLSYIIPGVISIIEAFMNILKSVYRHRTYRERFVFPLLRSLVQLITLISDI